MLDAKTSKPKPSHPQPYKTPMPYLEEAMYLNNNVTNVPRKTDNLAMFELQVPWLL